MISADILRRVPEKCSALLDLGAGYGDFINQASAPEKWAVDQWERFSHFLRPGIKPIVADIRGELALPEAHFDLCFMSNVLEHLISEDAEKVLANVRRHLRPGAYLALLQPNFTYCYRTYFDDYTHKTIYTLEGLSNFLADRGFKVIHRHPRYLPFSFKSRLPRPLWAVRAYLRSPWRPMGAQMLVICQIP